MARKKEGCRSCMVAEQTKDQQGNITFGKPEPIIGLEEFSYNYTYAEGSNYADNRQNIYKKKPTGVDISLTFTELLLPMEAKLMGKKYSKGGISTNVNDQAREVALLLQETFSDGSYVNNVFYNVKLSKDESSGKSAGENIDFTPATLSGRGIPLTNESGKGDGDIDFKMDSADPTVDKTKLDNFFKEVQFNDEVSTIEVVYTSYTTGTVAAISLEGVTFESSTKKFLNVPADTTTFTFTLDGTSTTATNSGGTWSFA